MRGSTASHLTGARLRWRIVVTLLVAVALLPFGSGISAKAAAPPPSEAQILLQEIVASPTMANARDAMASVTSIEAGPLTSPALAAAIAKVPDTVAGLSAATAEEGAAVDVLRAYLARPDVVSALEAARHYHGTVGASFRGVEGADELSAAVAALTNPLFQRGLNFWKKAAAVLAVVGGVLATIAACIGTVGVVCALAVGALVLQVTAQGIVLVEETRQEAGTAEGTVEFTGQCRPDGYATCYLDNIKFFNPLRRAVRVEIDFYALRPGNQPSSRRFVGFNYGYCGGRPNVEIYSPISGSNLEACFYPAYLPSGGAAYQNNIEYPGLDYWFMDVTDYDFVACSATVAVQVMVTWTNGNQAIAGKTYTKGVKVC